MAMTKEQRLERAAERKASKAALERAYAETDAIVRTGKCPSCGSALRRNSSLSGWWQCEQNGAEGFRARSQEAACSWQGFTSEGSR